MMQWKERGTAMSCNGNCSGCNGCAGALTLCPEEVAFLEKLAQIPFLPVARTPDDPTPVYLEEGERQAWDSRRVLALLEKKGLISPDFAHPLKGFAPPSGCGPYLWGSIGLTQRGQQVLDILRIQGAED